MSVFKRSDVKNHLHSPFLAKTHLGQPESQPDATGFSAAEPGAIKWEPSLLFAEDFVEEHSSSSAPVTSADRVISPASPLASIASKSAKA